ncbi:terminase small subunit [Prauserella flavalba]|uniref:terminase small subunit n=1 Tax=Prauserella flavalba TaxID=1477506 RepID=UPI0036E05708
MSAEASGLQAADRLLLPAVTESLASLTLNPEDRALSRLAETYARQLDQAAGAAAQADKVLRAARAEEDPDLVELVSALKAKLAVRVAVESLGPKLLAALDALGASPKARAARAKGGAAGGAKGKLAALRESRAG